MSVGTPSRFQQTLLLPPLQAVASQADANSNPAWLIGGYVRDTLLGRPCKDIDVVCLGDGIRLAEAVAAQYPGGCKVTVFKNFGTAMLHWDDWVLEFVGARKESYRGNSRKPDVLPGTLQEDQQRRDFTINTLSISLNKSDFGQLHDPFGGMEDLRRGMLRTPLEPNVTFSDDPLRMMRAIRFAAQLGFDIEADTYAAIQAQHERITIVSQERITDELNKMILVDKPSYGLQFLFHTGLLQMFFPEFAALAGVEIVDGKSHKDNFFHTLKVLDNLSLHTDDVWLRWSAILHDIAKPLTKKYHPEHGWTFHGHEDLGARMVPTIFRRLKLPMQDRMRYVQKLVRLHLRPIALVKDVVTDAALRRLLFEAGDDIHDLMKLCRADITSKDGNRVKRYLENFDKVERKLQEVEERDQVRNLHPVVTGEHLMHYFNIPPGRDIGLIKHYLKEAILEGKIKNNWDEAFALAKSKAKELGYSNNDHCHT
jgi:putative nucleotidyltransferase with HDIG domain